MRLDAWFVSGLREFLGDMAGTLKVTKLAKLKTTAQMIAIATLFSQGVFEHYVAMSTYGMNDDIIAGIIEGDVVDELGLVWKLEATYWSGQIGLWLLWIAAALTLITGIDYFAKSLPHLKDDT